MSILDTFYILFESDTSKLDKGLDASDKKSTDLVGKLGKVDDAAGKVGDKLFKLLGSTAGLLGVGLSVGALVAGIKDTAKAYDSLDKLATRLRDSTDAVDEFIDASELLDVGAETSEAALKGLDTAIQDIHLGLGRARKVFEELGLTITGQDGKLKSATVVMGELADKFKGMERGTQIRVMERLGLDPALLRVFNADLTELRARMAEVDRASGFNLDEAVKRAKEYTKADKALAVEVNILSMFMEKLAESFKVAALPVFTEALTTATRYVRLFVDYLMKHSKVVEGAVIALAAAIGYFLVPAAIRGAAAVWAMVAPFALIALAVVAVGGAFALLYEDVMTFIAGGDSLTGRLLDWIQAFPLFTAAVDFVRAAFTFAKQAIGDFLADNPALLGMLDGLTTAAQTFGAALSLVWQLIKLIAGGAGAALSWLNGAPRRALGAGSDWVAELLTKGKLQLESATRAPLASQTTSSIIGPTNAPRTTTLSVDRIEVKTQATDAEGISKAIGGSLESQMRQTMTAWDDGVIG